MFIVPSVLTASYNPTDLRDRFVLALKHHTRFLQLSRQSLPTTWHFDFVLPEFASARNIPANLDLAAYFDTFRAVWPRAAVLQIHLMGVGLDLANCLDFFAGYEFHSEWFYQILVPEVTADWLQLEGHNQNVQIGVWYDLGQWESIDEFEQGVCLLMTVQAGRSGQHLTKKAKAHSLSLVSKYERTNFILDGGWSVEFESNLSNLSVVSDSSFWQAFHKQLLA